MCLYMCVLSLHLAASLCDIVVRHARRRHYRSTPPMGELIVVVVALAVELLGLPAPGKAFHADRCHCALRHTLANPRDGEQAQTQHDDITSGWCGSAKASVRVPTDDIIPRCRHVQRKEAHAILGGVNSLGCVLSARAFGVRPASCLQCESRWFAATTRDAKPFVLKPRVAQVPIQLAGLDRR